MGLLVDGIWHDEWYDTKSTQGKFVRKESAFRNWVTRDGEAGPTGRSGFKAEAGRYHLYVSHACPWAHRTMIFRALLGLQEVISASVVDPLMREKGWVFPNDGTETDSSLPKAEVLADIYVEAERTYTGRVTVPVLWDRQQQTIVSNESSEIIRMMNDGFRDFSDLKHDFYPEALRGTIDAINEKIYHGINNGVYKAGFATTQEAYEEAVTALFETLDDVENLLSSQPYLAGDTLSEADWRLFTTLVRFDPVYVGHFKCNLQRIEDYPHLSHYLRALYQVKHVAETVNMDHIKRHYYESHHTINPTAVVPKGPVLDLTTPHNREPIHIS